MSTNLRSILRASTLAAATLTLAALGASAASAAPSGQGASAEIDVVFACTSVDVHSTKDLSNVVLQFTDGTTQRFEGLNDESGTFAGTGEHADDVISTVWVKSGANFSNEGPGYGERFDSTESCEQTQDSQTGGDTGEEQVADKPSSEAPAEDGDEDAADDSNDSKKGKESKESDEDEGTPGEAPSEVGPATKLEKTEDGTETTTDRTEVAGAETSTTEGGADEVAADDASSDEIMTDEVTVESAEVGAVEAADNTAVGTAHSVTVDDSDDDVAVLGVKLTRDFADGDDTLAAADSALAYTGADATTLMLLALLALVGGAVALATTRRRMVA